VGYRGRLIQIVCAPPVSSDGSGVSVEARHRPGGVHTVHSQLVQGDCSARSSEEDWYRTARQCSALIASHLPLWGLLQFTHDCASVLMRHDAVPSFRTACWATGRNAGAGITVNDVLLAALCGAFKSYAADVVARKRERGERIPAEEVRLFLQPL